MLWKGDLFWLCNVWIDKICRLKQKILESCSRQFDYIFWSSTPPPASRRDHRNGERPRGARLRGQDGYCHKKSTRGNSQLKSLQLIYVVNYQKRNEYWILKIAVFNLIPINALVHQKYWIFLVNSQSANFLKVLFVSF